jgi:membrane protease YdiL (CAAX protease family)
MNIAELLKRINENINAADFALCLAGLILFGYWLLRTSLGRKALADSLPRRNDVPVHVVFIPLFIWFLVVPLAIMASTKKLPELTAWESALLNNAFFCIGGIIAMIVIIHIVRVHFVRKLDGFGLNFKTLHRDFPAAVINLLTAWPLITVMFVLTIRLGELTVGPDFKMPEHESLEQLTKYPQLPLKIMIICSAVIVAPLFEEMLFRGLIQTMLRGFISRLPVCRDLPNESLKAWLAIVITSAMFAIIHASPAHWPALFMLSICLGYSYEKSGSLLRPIFIHLLFNAMSVIAALYSG